MNISEARTVAQVFASHLARTLNEDRDVVTIREDIAEDLTIEPHVIILPLRNDIAGTETRYLVRTFYIGEMLSSVGRLYAVPTLLEIMADGARDELAKLVAA